ncbi:hypothetical protein ACQJBY_058639 [Aegilops geniculata]
MALPSPSLFLLHPFVDTYLTGDETAKIQRPVLSSGPKQAFGLPEDVDCQAIMGRLELEADLASAPDLSRLTLRGGSLLSTSIHAVDKNLIIISTAFPEEYYHGVLLIYDAIDRSLSMIPSAPITRPPVYTTHVLAARRRDDDRSYSLVFPGSIYDTGSEQKDVLFVSPSSSKLQWQKTKCAKFPDHLSPDKSSFVAKDVFSHRGRGYWVDLLLGGMYCDCSDVLSDDTRPVDISSLELPVGCERYSGRRESIPEARAFRAIGCVGDSIKFVSITGFLERVDLVDDRMVRIWKLMEDMSWGVECEFKLGSLREEGEFKGNNLPTSMAPMYPFLSLQEDHVIYFALGECIKYQENCFPSKPSYWVRVDTSSKTFNCTRFSLTDASIGGLIAVSGNSEGKLAWTSSQEDVGTQRASLLPPKRKGANF